MVFVEEALVEGYAPLQDVEEVMFHHVVIDLGLTIVNVVLGSKLMDDHEARLNKQRVTNYWKEMTSSSLGSYLSDLRLNLPIMSQYE